MKEKHKTLIFNSIYSLWWIVLLLSLGESVTYHGFFERHAHINLIFLISVSLVGIIFAKLKWRKRKTDLQTFTDRWNKRIFFYLGGLTVLLFFLEKMTYDNFVFSKVHIQPWLLLFPFFVSLTPYVLTEDSILKNLLSARFLLKVLLLALIGWVLYSEFYLGFKFVRKDLLYMLDHPRASYDEKMAYTVGEKFYNFTKFVKENTPEDSTILIPPQGYPWPQTGNIPYIRYFLFPRNLINGMEYEPVTDLTKVDYVFIAWGETEGTQYGFTHGWPKFNVEADRIILWNRNGENEVLKKVDYDYKKYTKKEYWGLIEVKN